MKMFGSYAIAADFLGRPGARLPAAYVSTLSTVTWVPAADRSAMSRPSEMSCDTRPFVDAESPGRLGGGNRRHAELETIGLGVNVDHIAIIGTDNRGLGNGLATLRERHEMCLDAIRDALDCTDVIFTLTKATRKVWNFSPKTAIFLVRPDDGRIYVLSHEPLLSGS